MTSGAWMPGSESRRNMGPCGQSASSLFQNKRGDADIGTISRMAKMAFCTWLQGAYLVPNATYTYQSVGLGSAAWIF